MLDGQTLARIWAGEITTWDNEAIKSLNPTVATKLPATDILLTFAPNNVSEPILPVRLFFLSNGYRVWFMVMFV